MRQFEEKRLEDERVRLEQYRKEMLYLNPPLGPFIVKSRIP